MIETVVPTDRTYITLHRTITGQRLNRNSKHLTLGTKEQAGATQVTGIRTNETGRGTAGEN